VSGAALLAIGIFGACVGSFLNVVIYRVPKGLSIHRPRWSFCPSCKHTIRFYDNIPVISFLLLRGRCRDCQAVITARNPIIEALTALLFVTLADAFFVQHERMGFVGLPEDLPVFVGYAALVAGLLVVSAIDLEEYLVDVVVIVVVTAIGLLGHLFWTPTAASVYLYPRPSAVLGAGALAAAVVMALVSLLVRLRRQAEPEESNPPDSVPATADEPAKPSLGPAFLLVVVIIGWAGMWLAGRSTVDPLGYHLRVALLIISGFVVLVAGSMVHRPSDQQVIEAIERERPGARRLVLLEAARLLPALVIGGAVAWLLHDHAGAWHAWRSAWNWQPMGTSWRPILGLATGVDGLMLAGGIAWGVRIVFTLIFGKEALGFGDVYIVAAVGAVAGWEVGLMAIPAAACLALAGLAVQAARKFSKAIPFGPWLALATVVVILYHDPLVERIIYPLKHALWLLRNQLTG
jgi:leader peptidase (prepilin peptidase)/N-methyltransferase